MPKCLIRKLKSTSGATLMMALLFFILCAVVGSVILAAAATSAGRAGNPDTDENKQRYALMSASRLISKEISKPNSGGKDPGVDFKQTWMTRSVQVDLVGAEGDSTAIMKPDDIVSGEECHTRGDYVLALDQKSGYTYGSTYSAKHTPNEEDEVEGSEDLGFENVWKYGNSTDGNSCEDVFITAGLSKTSHKLDVTKASFTSLQQMRDVMTEGVYRHFWTDISQYKDSTDTDPWGGSTPSGSGDWKAPSEYTISAKHLMIDSGDEDIYPVFADVTMDQDLKLTFELYCGSKTKDTDTTKTITDPAKSMIRVWVVFKPSGTKVSYKNITSVKDKDLPDLTTRDEQTQTVEGDSSAPAATTTEDGTTITVKAVYDTASDKTTITTITEEKISRQKHITLQNRSVDFTANWKAAIVTTKDPTAAAP